jgi:hypothetical protein
MSPLFYTLDEAADLLKLKQLGYDEPVKTLKRWASKGQIPHHYLRRDVVFTMEDLQNALAKATNSQGILGMQSDSGREADLLELRKHRDGEQREGDPPAKREVELAPGTVKLKLAQRGKTHRILSAARGGDVPASGRNANG